MIPTTHYGRPFKDLTPLHLDFEYNDSSEMFMNLVCCVTSVGRDYKRFWLHKHKMEKSRLKEFLLSRRETHILVAFNVVAEASSLISLGLDPTKFAWIDLQIEYKMLLNHWNKYRYGKQLLKGKEKKTYPPVSKWEKSKDEDSHAKPESNLGACIYKMLEVKIDTEHKTEMRDLIISKPDRFTWRERDAIVDYCYDDVKYLPLIKEKIFEAFRASAAKKNIFLSEVTWRGNVAARAALMSQTGYPVNKEAVEKFSGSVKDILNEIAKDINLQFPDKEFFVWNKKREVFTKRERPQQEWITTTDLKDRWRKTPTDNFSLSLDAFSDHFTYSHDYPRDVIPAQIIRYLKTKQSLNGFVPSGKSNFFDYYGRDGRARAWLNPYGSQSSRYQPGATGFIPLKSAWMRSLIQPTRSRSIVGIDYGSEEFLLAALLSGDENMFEAYASGDPYFHFAKLAGAVPQDAERKNHEDVRLLFKSTVLGISYLMSKAGLAPKLTRDTGKEYTEDQAQKLIDTFFEVFSKYAEYIERTTYEYSRRGFLKLPDGWIMFGDNPNHRSISNCPVQGMGGVILRKAIELAQKEGLRVIIPLHDALYVDFEDDKPESVDILFNCMKEAFSHYFQEDEQKFEWSNAMRMDIDVWGPDREEGYFETAEGNPFKSQIIYIDPRSKNEYEKFKKYL